MFCRIRYLTINKNIIITGRRGIRIKIDRLKDGSAYNNTQVDALMPIGFTVRKKQASSRGGRSR